MIGWWHCIKTGIAIPGAIRTGKECATELA
jgi:hypothetical protein